MFFRVGGEDEEVIHVDDQPSFSNHVLEGVIHESLEGGGGIAQSEEHDHGFKESFVHDERSFPLVSFLDTDIIVAQSYIHLRENRCSLEFVNKREGICIFYCVLIQISVILARAKGAIFLPDKEKGGSLRGLQGADFSLSKVFFDEFLHRLSFRRGEWICLGHLGDKVLYKVNGMVIGS
ncbi:hypothetical protein M404DRAFT_153916 [Pisolithus tinctorius Marx 270]|uniref:Uncharacterized protein n=1 Tax=Pisolithus tinctorius Marx 270 TaxID=870435 RepID=A0A0C3NXP6_PISTI|nr:hypothetical protein M404DRAFT_153916 [Pisolithus tinctorius Marx 270]